MKKLLSILLCVLVVAGCLVIPSFAEGGLPESEHNYADNFYKTWYYQHPTDAELLFVTFDYNTHFSSSYRYCDVHPEGCYESDCMETKIYSSGDTLYIYDGNGSLVGWYGSNDLAGRTIAIPGSSFRLSLTTDGFHNSYGFKVVSVVADTIPEDSCLLRYHLGEQIYSDYIDGTSGFLIETKHAFYKGGAVIGWKTEDGKEFYYAEEYFDEYGVYVRDYDFVAHEGGVYDLYPITTPLQLRPEDVYYFINTDYDMLVDGENRYYFTDEHKKRLPVSLLEAADFSELTFPALVLSGVLATYDKWEWAGSCIGFANTVCLQKKGILDVVSTQEGATCVRDLKATPELISLLNYYNAHSAASIVTKNIALIPGSREYTRQMKNLVESAKAGNLILFEFLPTGALDVFSQYHGVVVMGAYTRPDGKHVLLCYDENEWAFARMGYCEEIVIEADYSGFEDYYEDCMFFWTDEFESFKSLDIYGRYDDENHLRNIYRQNILNLIKVWFEEYFLGIFKIKK